jgi:GntR family transcriptional repressor for pyruvate dehydrogenase complex
MSDIPNRVKPQEHDRRKAYERIAAGLRERILSGELALDERLPVESDLASHYGVSRATVREALRLLTAQNLIVTAKGRTGGSYVSAPSLAHITEFVRSGLDLLTDGRRVSLDELLEARELLEVPAARLAAQRRSEEQLTQLEACTPPGILTLSPTDQFSYNEEFHSIVIRASGNTLLGIAAQPIFTVLQRNLSRSALGRRFHSSIRSHHHAIAAAIAQGDADAADGEMRAHLRFLHPFYERAWRDLGGSR